MNARDQGGAVIGLPLSRWPWARDAALFFTGIWGIVHETVSEHSDRPQLLMLFAAMVGLPAFLRRNGGK